MREAVESCYMKTTFVGCPKVLNGRRTLLRRFADGVPGGIDDLNKSATELSLVGVLRAKQLSMLAKLRAAFFG